ncbi:MAG: tRNA uridine-5-carboxymethylaminomethyl(34) synthesis GTPase MnmE [Candidatus Omnitrophica bacterium]|nr:tRNA uridine-5-carboxymethylaminomethyl(34) synthesis GTPase MnmE [Candidatus Omnitrophota bacterium]
MVVYGLKDTIAAISTPLGESGIGIVRLSGKDALTIADKIFFAKDNKKPSTFKTYTTHYGWIKKDSEIIDEVILTVMRSPKSYTKEDVVEINCHGGITALRAVLDLVLESGARLAEPGEFTKRAFLNGRIDLVQAEAVLDIIKAKTDLALKLGIEQLKGVFSKQISSIRQKLLDLLSILEANIDFPDEEIGSVNLDEIHQRLEQINGRLKFLLEKARYGRVLREGMSVVICGRPNVGKSSLLNAILRQERAIVTPVAGTTRDTIEEMINIKGIPIRVVDTAGIIEPKDLIEKKAVERSKRQIDLADLIILVFDGSRRLNREDSLLIKRLQRKTKIVVINKIDLKQRIEKDKIIRRFQYVVETSAKNLKNIDLLENKIADLVYSGRIISSESLLVGNRRHAEAIKKTQKFVAGAIDSLDNKLSLEFIAQDIKEALGYLDDILGGRFSEELLDKIFSEFCIGK